MANRSWERGSITLQSWWLTIRQHAWWTEPKESYHRLCPYFPHQRYWLRLLCFWIAALCTERCVRSWEIGWSAQTGIWTFHEVLPRQRKNHFDTTLGWHSRTWYGDPKAISNHYFRKRVWHWHRLWFPRRHPRWEGALSSTKPAVDFEIGESGFKWWLISHNIFLGEWSWWLSIPLDRVGSCFPSGSWRWPAVGNLELCCHQHQCLLQTSQWGWLFSGPSCWNSISGSTICRGLHCASEPSSSWGQSYFQATAKTAYVQWTSETTVHISI